MSLAQIGKKRSEETKRKMSMIMKGKMVGKNNPFYGKKHTEETKRKIGLVSRGRLFGETKVVMEDSL